MQSSVAKLHDVAIRILRVSEPEFLNTFLKMPGKKIQDSCEKEMQSMNVILFYGGDTTHEGLAPKEIFCETRGT